MEDKTSLYHYIMGTGKKRQLPSTIANLVKWIAIGTTLYIMWSVFSYPDALLHRSTCFGLFFALTFLIYSMPGTQTKNGVPWYDWLFAISSITVSVYIFTNFERILYRYPFVDKVYTTDIFFALLTIFLLLEGTRRVTGPWLSLLCLLSFAYALLGQHIPGLFGHNGFSLTMIVDELFLTTEGIWGMALGMAVTYIIIFIIFGSFLRNSGAADFLFDFSSAIAGWRRGGLAKVGIIASGLFGMISGSPAANVSTSGIITIPMMKKSGYPPRFAAAVECCASTGGTIMPPVMGSVAFLMAEVIGIPYIKVAAAALLPAIIYFMALYFTIDFRAGKLGMQGLPRDQIAPLGKTLLEGMVFFIPLVYLIVRLMMGYSPSRAGFETIIITFAVSWLRVNTRMDISKTLKALAEGTTQGIMIVTTMATSGIMIGIMTLTGVGVKFSSFLIAMSGESVLITLVFTMCLAVFLGLAMNITPSYLLTAVVAAPALINMGISPIAAHMFILFFAAMAPLTPPVAVTAFTAAGIAGADPMRVSFLAIRIALAAYIMPFIFIYQPGLLLDAPLLNIIVALVSGLFAVALMAMSMEGWFGRNLGRLPRIVLFAAGLLALSGYLPLLVVSLALTALALVPYKVFRGHSRPGKFKEIEIKK